MPDPIKVQYTLRDTGPNRESVQFNLFDTSTLAQIQTETTAFAPLLDAITGAVIEKATVTFPLTLPGGIKTDPVADYRNTRGALIGFDVLDSRYRWTNRVPAILEAFISGNDIIIGISGDLFDYTQWLAALSDPGPAINYTNQYDEGLLAVLGAALSETKRRR